MASSYELKRTKQDYETNREIVIAARDTLVKPYATLEKIKSGVKASFQVDDSAADDNFILNSQEKIKNVEAELNKMISDYDSKISRLKDQITEAQIRERREKEKKEKEKKEKEESEKNETLE